MLRVPHRSRLGDPDGLQQIARHRSACCRRVSRHREVDLGDLDTLRIEAPVDRRAAPYRVNKDTGAREQHDTETHLHHDERVAQPQTGGGTGDCVWRAAIGSIRAACSAGTRPHAIAATSAIADVTSSTRPSMAGTTAIGSVNNGPSPRGPPRGKGNTGPSAMTIPTMPRATTTPPRAPTANSRTVSVSTCRTRCARPAPIATRIAISRRRARPRASRTPARWRRQSPVRERHEQRHQYDDAAEQGARLPGM